MKKLYFATLLLISSQFYVTAQCTDLFFSEYIEGSSNNKALEIYNPSSDTVDMSNYSILSFMNGSASVTSTFLPKGKLAPESVYMIINSNADSVTLKPLADTLSGGNIVKFNGDDAIALLHGTDTLDIFGEIGVLPSSGYWTVDTGKTLDYTLVRKAAVNDGETNWTTGATQWTAYSKDDFTHAGSHTMTPCTTTKLHNVNTTSTVISIFPNPVLDNLYVENLSANSTISIYDILGKKINCITSATNSGLSIHVGNLNKGVYLLSIKTNGQQIVKRFVKA